jgi:hypothetical protein
MRMPAAALGSSAPGEGRLSNYHRVTPAGILPGKSH